MQRKSDDRTRLPSCLFALRRAAGEAIPLGARILTVVDSYSAIVDKRVYKEARTNEEASVELKRNAGTQFDPHLVEVFLRLLERGQ